MGGEESEMSLNPITNAELRVRPGHQPALGSPESLGLPFGGEAGWPRDRVIVRRSTDKADAVDMDPRVRAIREAIQNGTYRVDDKLDYVVDELHSVLRSEHGQGRQMALGA